MFHVLTIKQTSESVSGYSLWHQVLMSQEVWTMLQKWAKHEFQASVVNRLITFLSDSLVIQDYYNDTLPDPSTVLQKQFWWLLT